MSSTNARPGGTPAPSRSSRHALRGVAGALSSRLGIHLRAIVAALASSALLAGIFVGIAQSPAAAATPPVAVNDTYTTSTSSAIIQSAPGVLANDTDDGPASALAATIATNPSNGSVNLNPDGSFTYNATANFVGTDSFTYTVSDGADGSSVGTVTISVFRDPAELLKDITPGSNQTTPIRAIDMGNGTAFFFGWGNTANVAGLTPGKGIYKTDGTAAGTSLVLNVDIGSTNDSPITPGPVSIGGGKAVFYATDTTNGREPWVSDGTAAGTFALADINPGTASSIANNFTNIGGGIALFTAFNPSTGVELYRTDGTVAGTSMVKDINPGTVSGSPNCGALTFAGFFVWNSKAYFCATTATSGNELWTSDGTTAGTQMLKEIRAGSASASPNGFSIFNGLMWFQANDGTNGAELWNSDGTAANTNMFMNINPGSANSSPSALNPLGSIAVFNATGSTATGSELWKTDGTVAGTSLVLDIRAGTSGSGAANFTPVAGKLMFTANDGTATGQHGIEPWITDGTTAGTQLLKDINPGTAGSQPSSLTAFGGVVYMTILTNTYGFELGRSDGTTAGTVLAQDINPGANSAMGLDIRPALGTLLFEASDATHGLELWHLRAPNVAPVAADDSYSTNEDTPLTVSAPGVVGNDTDAESNVLHDAVKMSDPTNGSVTFNSDGSFTYTPNANYNGPDSFTYKSYDGMDYSNVATVSLTVNSVNDAPVAVDDTASTAEDTPVTVNAPGVLGNDSDSDGGTLSAGSPSDPANGSVTLNADGSYTYTPDADFNGADSFTYVVDDGQGGTDTGTVNITVSAVNDAPVAVDDTSATAMNIPVTVNAPGVLGNDTDVDADTLSAGSASDPAGGSVVLNADGSFTYTPDAGFVGVDTFTYVASDGQGGTDSATVSVTVADTSPTALYVGDVSVDEGNVGTTTATITVTRTGITSGPSTVKYKTSGGTATAGDDYTGVGLSTLSFAPGETSKPVTVDIAGDNLAEANEAVNLVLSAPTGAVIADATGVATIVNDDGATYLSVGNVTVSEGNSGTTPAVFTVTRTGNTNGTSTVKVKTGTGTATAGSDYTAVPLTTVTFNPGDTTQTVTVDVLTDTVDEVNENFPLMLSAPTGATLADTSGTGYITDDDGVTNPPAASTYYSVDNIWVAEGDAGTTGATFTVTRSGVTTGSSTVKVKTSGGTATAGTDYTAVPLTTVSFGPGDTTQTVTVDVAGDTVPEADETLSLVLSSPTGGVIADATGTATVANDDGAAYLGVKNTTVTEGDAGTATATFIVTRSGNTSAASTVKVKTTNGSAAAGSDYTAVGLTTVSFGAGETTKSVSVDVSGDTTVEKNETFNLVLSAATGATISDVSGTATIVNDD